MARIQVLISIGVLSLSFVFGIIFFWLISPLGMKQKKLIVNQILSMLINFILYIWVGKIIMNLSLFLRDPIAVLAYPSDSKAFYFACLWMLITLLLQKEKWKTTRGWLALGGIPIFFGATYFYEFIQLIYFDHLLSINYLAFMTLLIFFYVFIGQKMKESLHTIWVYIWLFGQLFLFLINPYITIFQYIISPFFIGFIILGLGVFQLYIKPRMVN